uniref:Uncharacterized protein n=1 Tax=Mimivirus LCMiAC01 TaxID=2506608 RepID=A0A481YZE1_9VIRU|nr:MAG: hypothetical protein LCMiAC01_02060 [Mimivirus LCMiAC01]
MDISQKIKKYTRKLNSTNNPKKISIYNQKLKYYGNISQFGGDDKMAIDVAREEIKKEVAALAKIKVSSEEECAQKLLEKTGEIEKLTKEHGTELDKAKVDHETALDKTKEDHKKALDATKQEQERVVEDAKKEGEAKAASEQQDNIDKLKAKITELSEYSEKADIQITDDKVFLANILGDVGKPGIEITISPVNLPKYPEKIIEAVAEASKHTQKGGCAGCPGASNLPPIPLCTECDGQSGGDITQEEIYKHISVIKKAQADTKEQVGVAKVVLDKIMDTVDVESEEEIKFLERILGTLGEKPISPIQSNAQVVELTGGYGGACSLPSYA